MSCFFGRRCADPNALLASPQPQYGPFCTHDHRKVAETLSALPMVRLSLDLAIGTEGSYDGGYPTVYPPVPIRLDVEALRREMDDAVGTWFDALTQVKSAMVPVGAKLHTKVGYLRDNLLDLYAIPPVYVMRWVPERYVPSLPVWTEGIVTASGDAIVTRQMTGAEGAAEMLTLTERACKLLRIDLPR